MDINTTGQKKCSFCSEEIPADAGRCPYCGSLLEVRIDEGGMTIMPRENTEFINENNGSIMNNQADTTGGGIGDAGKPGTGTPVDNGFQDPKTAPSYYSTRTYGTPSYSTNFRKPISNGMKVFLTILFTVIPGIGQLAGIITAIVFMNAEDDADRKSFGVALLVASLIMFVLSCISCFVIFLAYGFSVKQ